MRVLVRYGRSMRIWPSVEMLICVSTWCLSAVPPGTQSVLAVGPREQCEGFCRNRLTDVGSHELPENIFGLAIGLRS